MAEPPGQVKAGQREQLRTLIERWDKLRSRIRDLNEQFESGTIINPNLLDDLREDRATIVGRIKRIVEERPGLRDFAVNQGFREDLLPKGGGTGGTENSAAGEDSDINRGKKPEDDTGAIQRPKRNIDDGKNRPVGNRQGGGQTPLPGVKGKDYRIVRRGDSQYAVYVLDIGGNKVRVAIRIGNAARSALGIGKNDGDLLTQQQFRNVQVLGGADEFEFNEGERNPFRALVRMIQRSYGGTAIMDDDEVLGVVIAATAGGWSDGELQGALRQTDWYKRSTRYARDWNLNSSPAERRKTILFWKEAIQDKLVEIYGGKWSQHFKPGDIGGIALKIASGQMGIAGEPQSGFNLWASQQEDKAKRVEGTPAWVVDQEAKIADRDFKNRPEEMFERIRGESLAWLGYFGKPDRETLKAWAEDLAFSRKSDGDWMDFLRKQKQRLYPYLDPDTPWQDFASSYKARAEELLGKPLSWEDKLFADLTKKDANGTPVGDGKFAASFSDFETAVRKDARWNRSKAGMESVSEFTALIDSVFNGGRAA